MARGRWRFVPAVENSPSSPGFGRLPPGKNGENMEEAFARLVVGGCWGARGVGVAVGNFITLEENGSRFILVKPPFEKLFSRKCLWLAICFEPATLFIDTREFSI